VSVTVILGRRAVAALLGLAGLLGVIGCAASEPDRPHVDTSSSPASTAPAVDPLPRLAVGQVRRQLALLPRAPRPHRASDYRRDAFGSSWSDVDGNGCNQRDDILLRDAQAARVQQQGRCDHDVLAGTWIDPYTGRTSVFDDLKDLHQAQALQIDHVVPLAEAWVSGARGWSPARRHRFANDLSGLLAVSGSANASKGSGDPAAWRPRKGYQCAYAKRWVAVKYRWRLAADASEVAALEDMLDRCAG
jgi:hypothetical protein